MWNGNVKNKTGFIIVTKQADKYERSTGECIHGPNFYMEHKHTGSNKIVMVHNF